MKIITDPAEALDALKRHQIPIHLWNGGNSTTIERFLETMRTDAIQLEEYEDNGPKLRLHTHVVVAHIQVCLADRFHQLYEDRVYCPATRQGKRRSFNGSLGGKPRRTEPLTRAGLIKAMQREIKEELGQTEPRFAFPDKFFDVAPRFGEFVLKEDWHRGLPELFTRFHFYGIIHPDLYHEEYAEVNKETGRIATFKWKQVDDQDNPDDMVQPTPGSQVFSFPG